MFVVLVDFDLVPGSATAFMPLMQTQARTSLAREPGCHRFDVCVDETDANRVVLYEIYEDRAAFDDHLASAHFVEFDTAVAPFVAGKSVRIMTLANS